MTVPGDWTDNVPKRQLLTLNSALCVSQKSYFSTRSLLGSYERRGWNGPRSSASMAVPQLNCLIYFNSPLNAVKKRKKKQTEKKNRESLKLQGEGGNVFQRVKVQSRARKGVQNNIKGKANKMPLFKKTNQRSFKRGLV